ncbi:MAG TPA: NAD(P)/FAD-dependent oxidoreductase [Steroidobacteraceae bacterium]|nr:NAD(P)/FAD-dependent oxidoreductase [Steroidobacteraceae bacterium]
MTPAEAAATATPIPTTTATAATQRTHVAIIGAGHAGLCMAIRLKQAGLDDFVILEKAATLGGTWRDNTYPGASCDAPSFLYSFSFAQKTDWSRRFAWASELLGYSTELAIRHGLLSHCRFTAEVTQVVYDDAANIWTLTCADGTRVVADFVVTGTGQLNRPSIPDVPGRETFRGAQFHSAQWDHAIDLGGKRIAVIGNAASAVQFVPQIAPLAARLTVFQRSANWLLPRKDRLYAPRTQRLLTRHPRLARWYHAFQWFFFGEMQLTPLMKQVRFVQWLARRKALAHLRRQVPDPALRARLVPDYPIGAKRVLFNDDYYPALGRANVRLVTDGIERLEPTGVRTRDGELHEADVIVWATGFKSTDFLAPMQVVGRGGRRLADEWRRGAHAYLGVTVSGFPNFFMLYGPNTNLGHNSILVMIEAQVGYVIDALAKMRARGLARIDVRRAVMDDYNRALQRDLARSVWSTIDASWYKLADGTITNNWPHSTIRYRRLLREAHLEDFES